MKYRVATILLLFISLLSFSQQQNFTLSGKIKGLGNDSVYITLNSTDKNGNRLKPEIMVVKAKDGADGDNDQWRELRGQSHQRLSPCRWRTE